MNPRKFTDQLTKQCEHCGVFPDLWRWFSPDKDVKTFRSLQWIEYETKRKTIMGLGIRGVEKNASRRLRACFETAQIRIEMVTLTEECGRYLLLWWKRDPSLSSYMAFDYYRKERFNARLSLFFSKTWLHIHFAKGKKDLEEWQIKVSLSESVTWLRGAWGDTGIPFFFFVYKKMEHWKKWEESSTESVHINKITTHKSHSGTRCDLCSKLK